LQGGSDANLAYFWRNLAYFEKYLATQIYEMLITLNIAYFIKHLPFLAFLLAIK